MKREEINRREMLVMGRNLMIASLAAGLPIGCSVRRSAGGDEWAGEIRPVDGMGLATVTDQSGSIYAGHKSLSIGDSLKSGEVVTVADRSKLVLSLPDRSVIQLKGESRMKLDLDSKEGGDLTLKYGALLSVITSKRRNRRYRIKGAAAQFDVKGTVSFLQTFKPGQVSIKGVPDRATDYFCLCNGTIDYLNPAGNQKEKSINSDYHQPYFLFPDGTSVGFIDTNKLFNHDDREIQLLIDHMTGEKHDNSWLKKYKTGYDY